VDNDASGVTSSGRSFPVYRLSTGKARLVSDRERLLVLGQWFDAALCVQITVQILNQMIAKIREELPGLEANEDTDQINKHFNNTLQHITTYRQLHASGSGGGGGQVYDGIEL